MTRSEIPLGIIGGTGLDSFPELEALERVPIVTPYGKPSADPLVAKLNGRLIVFIPRHGEQHQYAPHLIPYKANLWALRELGARAVIGTCVAGSLKLALEPGHFIVPDQFMNFTWGRDTDSVEPNGQFMHLSVADPYCEELRQELNALLDAENIQAHKSGTVVVIQGPRFNSRAESLFQIRNEWDLVNMTQYPECVFARELGLCYATLASITDWDIGLGTTLSMQPGNMDRVLRIFRENTVVTKRLLALLIGRLDGFSCSCAAHTVSEYYKQGAT